MLGLTSNPTFYLSATLSLLLVFILVLLWQKLFRKGLLNLLSRLLLLLLCQVLILATVGLAINRSNGFYSSWGDLTGKTVDLSNVAISSNESATIDAAILKGSKKSVGGQVIIKDVVKGQKSGVSSLVYIVLPKSVVDKIISGKPIDLKNTKIVEFLAGFPSQPEVWFKSLNIANALVASEKDNPDVSIIGVFPSVNVAGKEDLECMNFPNGGVQTETWLTSDIHSYVDHRLGISPVRWGVIGASTGGWCSAMLSIKHEDLFYGAVSIAGYYRPALLKTTGPVVRAKLSEEYSFTQLEPAMSGKMDMLLITSIGDTYSFNETSRFRAVIHPKINYQYIELTSGGHNPKVWISQFGIAFNWLKLH